MILIYFVNVCRQASPAAWFPTTSLNPRTAHVSASNSNTGGHAPPACAQPSIPPVSQQSLQSFQPLQYGQPSIPVSSVPTSLTAHSTTSTSTPAPPTTTASTSTTSVYPCSSSSTNAWYFFSIRTAVRKDEPGEEIFPLWECESQTWILLGVHIYLKKIIIIN